MLDRSVAQQNIEHGVTMANANDHERNLVGTEWQEAATRIGYFICPGDTAPYNRTQCNCEADADYFIGLDGVTCVASCDDIG